jgi:hypothetical protein
MKPAESLLALEYNGADNLPNKKMILLPDAPDDLCGSTDWLGGATVTVSRKNHFSFYLKA